MMRLLCALWVAGATLGRPAVAADRGARAEDAAGPRKAEVPDQRLFWSNSVFFRVNPLGLINTSRLGWRKKLSTRDGVLWDDTYLFLGPSAVVTPAWVRGGALVEVQPLTVLRLWGEVSGTQFFGTFDQVLSFDDPGARYDDETIARLGEAGIPAPRGGWVATGGATVQAKAGRVAVRSTTSFTRFALDLPGDDAYFYDQLWDRLAPNNRWMTLTDTDVLGLFGPVRAGARLSWSDDIGAQPDNTAGGEAHARLGPLVAWQVIDRAPGEKVSQGTVFVVSQWWIRHPYRTGEVSSQAFPLIAVGYAASGDAKTW